MTRFSPCGPPPDFKHNKDLTLAALGKKRKKAARGVRFKSGQSLILYIAYYKSHFATLQVQQNNTVHTIITDPNLGRDTDAMFNESGLLNLRDINVYHVGKSMYTVFHEKVIDALQGFVVHNYQIRGHNTRTWYNLDMSLNFSNWCQTGISYHGVIIWSQIINAKFNIDCSEDLPKVLKKYIQLTFIQWHYFRFMFEFAPGLEAYYKLLLCHWIINCM